MKQEQGYIGRKDRVVVVLLEVGTWRGSGYDRCGGPMVAIEYPPSHLDECQVLFWWGEGGRHGDAVFVF